MGNAVRGGHCIDRVPIFLHTIVIKDGPNIALQLDGGLASDW